MFTAFNEQTNICYVVKVTAFSYVSNLKPTTQKKIRKRIEAFCDERCDENNRHNPGSLSSVEETLYNDGLSMNPFPERDLRKARFSIYLFD